MALMSSCRYYSQEVFWQSKWSVLSEWISAQLCSVSVFCVLQILVQYAKAVFLCCTNVFSICVLQYAQAVFFSSLKWISLLCNSAVFKPASCRCLSGKIAKCSSVPVQQGSVQVVGACLERLPEETICHSHADLHPSSDMEFDKSFSLKY